MAILTAPKEPREPMNVEELVEHLTVQVKRCQELQVNMETTLFAEVKSNKQEMLELHKQVEKSIESLREDLKATEKSLRGEIKLSDIGIVAIQRSIERIHD